MVKKKGVMIPLSIRREMITRSTKISISKQCELLSISRSTLYYKPCITSLENLAIMRRMDEMYLEDPTGGTRRFVDDLALAGVLIGRDKVRRLMSMMGNGRHLNKQCEQFINFYNHRRSHSSIGKMPPIKAYRKAA